MNYRGVELYEKSGKIGVLVSYGYGAGWSTWNVPALAYDKRVIEWWLSFENYYRSGKKDWEEVAKACLKSFGYKDVYCGGIRGLELDMVPKGKYFVIREYDGSEFIEYFDSERWNIFEEEKHED